MAGVKWTEDAYFPDGGECQTGDIIMGLRASANYKFDFPSTGIKDGNGNYLLGWDTVGASATNYLAFTNGVSGTPTKIEATGSDTDIDVDIVLKGTGQLDITGLLNVNGSTAVNSILDEDNMASDSPTGLATQQSIKAYVDASTGGGGVLAWNNVTGTSDTMAADNGYVANNAGLVTLTVPVSCAFGKVIAVQGLGAGGWKIAQNAGQTIKFGSSTTTTGVGGSLASTNQNDSVWLLCVNADTDFSVLGGPQGTLTVV